MSKMLDLIFKMDVFMGNGFSSSFSRVTQKISELQAKTQSLNAVSGKIESYQKRSRSLQTLGDKLAAAKQKELSLSDQVNFGTKANAQLLAEYKKAAKESQTLTHAYETQKKSLSELGSELTKSGVNLGNLTIEQQRYARASDEASAKLKRIQELQAKVNALNPREIWQNMKGDILQAYGAIKMFQKPIQISADFESAMARVKAAGFVKPQADLSEWEELRKQAIQLGRDTKFTAIQAANTQENLIRGGMSARQTMAAMPAVMAMAAAENIEVAESANIVVGALSAMNLPAEMAQRVTDIFANMSVSAKANIQTIWDSVSKAAPMAQTLEIPLEHLAALAAAGQMKGIDSSSVGTGIKTGLARLSKPTKEAQGVINELGLTIADKKGNFRQIDDLLGDLYTKLQKYGKAKQAGILSTIFGKQQVGVWTQLMNSAGKVMDDGQTLLSKYINSNYTEADGLVIRMQNINLDTYNGQVSLLSSAWTGLQQKIGDAVAPINRYVVETLAKGINKVTEFMNAHENLINTVIRVGYILGGVFVAFKIAKYIKLVYDFITAWAALQMATEGTSLAGAISSMGLLGLKIGAAVGALMLLIHYWEQIKELPATIDKVMQSAEVKKSLGATGASKMSRDDPDYGIAAMNDAFAIPSLKPRALGGLITRPEIALIGEAGPEAVIPLSPGKKSRGLQMLTQAASSLGVNIMTPEMRSVTGQVVNNTNQSNILRSIEYGADLQNVSSSSDIVRQSESLITNTNNYYGGSSSMSSRTSSISPAINITVNATGNELTESSGRSIAEDISSRVREVLSELMNDSDRLSYA